MQIGKKTSKYKCRFNYALILFTTYYVILKIIKEWRDLGVQLLITS